MPENPEPPQPENAKGETAKAAAGDTTSGDAKGKNGGEQSKRRMFGSVAFWALAVGLLILWAFGWYSGVCGRWVHLLPILALFAVIADLVTRGRRGDINPESGIAPKWDPDNPLTSLEKIRAYVIEEAANQSIGIGTRSDPRRVLLISSASSRGSSLLLPDSCRYWAEF